MQQAKLQIQFQYPYYFILQAQNANYIQLHEAMNFILQCIFANNSQCFEQREYRKQNQPPNPIDEQTSQLIQIFLQSFFQCSEICRYHTFMAPKTSISLFLYASLIIKQIKQDIQTFNNVIVTWQKRVIVTDCNSILTNYLITKYSLNQLTEDKINTYSNIYELPETLYIQQLKQGELIIFIISDQKIKKPYIQLQNYAERLKQYQQPYNPILNYQLSQVLIDADYNIFGVDYAGYLRKYGQQINAQMLMDRKDEDNLEQAIAIQNTKQQNIQILKSTKFGNIYSLYSTSTMNDIDDAEKHIETWVNV